MSTVAQVVDRTFRDWLTGGDKQPIRTRLTSSVTSSATTIPYTGTVAQADEIQALTGGVIIEVGLEQMIIEDVSASILTVIRGANGTTPTAHNGGDLLTIAPPIARQTVFDAVCDEVEALYPSVFRIVRETLPIPSEAEYVEVDETYETVREAYYTINGTVQRLTGHIERGLGSTGKVFTTTESVFHPYRFEPGQGQPATLGQFEVLFGAAFGRPTAETDDLTAMGVQTQWERIITIGAAAHVVAGTPELDGLDANFLSDQTKFASYPPGTAIQISQRLFSLRNNLLDDAASRWMRQNRQKRDRWVGNNRAKL